MSSEKIKENMAAIHEIDIDKARDFVRKAVEEANNAWISVPAISDALMLEFVDLAGRYTSPAQLADHLDKISDQLRQANNRTH